MHVEYYIESNFSVANKCEYDLLSMQRIAVYSSSTHINNVYSHYTHQELTMNHSYKKQLIVIWIL